jgi:hypothetical protein
LLNKIEAFRFCLAGSDKAIPLVQQLVKFASSRRFWVFAQNPQFPVVLCEFVFVSSRAEP